MKKFYRILGERDIVHSKASPSQNYQIDNQHLPIDFHNTFTSISSGYTETEIRDDLFKEIMEGNHPHY